MSANATREHLRDLVLNASAPELSESVRASQARTIGEYAADLHDLAGIASAVIGGSQASDHARIKVPHLHGTAGSDARASHERIQARRVAAQLRASQLLADNPGLVPRPIDVGDGSTGIGGGLPLIRRYAADRDFTEGGQAPVTPGVTAGDINGVIVTEGTSPGAGTAVTIADVGAAKLRRLGGVYAILSRQVIDWRDETANAMLDQALIDIADRAAEIRIGADLVAGAGGTRVAGADLTTLGTALDAAEAAAGAAMNESVGRVADGNTPGLLIVNPANWPKVRRVIGTSWPVDSPHPVVAVSIGAPAGTAIVTGPGALHLFREPVYWLPQPSPDTLGAEISVVRPFYLALRITTGVQTVTAIPA